MSPLNAVTTTIGPAVRRAGPALVRVGGAAIVLAVLWHRVGAAPFRDGLHAVTLPAVAAAVAITVFTTVCSAWRWRVVAHALGAGMPLPVAVGAYYRSQFLNSVLPGGIVGDVHRAVAHGRGAGSLGRGVRAVGWERAAGQVVQAGLTGAVLLALPSPVRHVLPMIVAVVVAAAGCAVLVTRLVARRGGARPAGVARTVIGDVRRVLLARRVWPRLAVSSAAIVAGHTAVFLIAARAAGAAAPLGVLVPLALLVQTAVVIPLSVGGWGPREGAAAWAFAAAGLGAATGVTVTTVYGVLSLAAVAPGLGVLAADAVRRVRGPRRRAATPVPVVAVRRGYPREIPAKSS